ncbi:MAG: C4-dicarboxylate transporter [Proteobacteria bacterium]|nr:C4-dicarboxylate transporter [Pseudomonadota bacterium]
MKAMSFRCLTKPLATVLGSACLLLSSHALALDVRLGHGFTEQHPRGQAMIRFASEVDKATNGQVKIKVFANSVLGSEEKMLQAIQGGVQEFYLGSLVPFSVRKKELQIFDFPFIFANDSEVAKVLDGPVGQKMLDDLGDTGAIGLTWAGGAFRNIANGKRPINKFEDLKGLKIRVMQSPVAIESFKAMGINATPMAYAEVFTALEIHALDGLEHPPVDMFQNKIYEVQKYLAITNHVYTPVALVVSNKWFSALPADQQAGIRKAAAIARDFERSEEIRQAKEAVDKLKANGMAVTELSPQELDKMRAAVRPVIEKFSTSIGADFVKRFYAEVDKVRKVSK